MWNSVTYCCKLHRYVQAELVHSRYAMAAVAGILIPEVSERLLHSVLVSAWS